jgi:predicted component of type VI protein secretion system
VLFPWLIEWAEQLTLGRLAPNSRPITLRAVSGVAAGKVVPLGDLTIVGRALDCTVVVADPDLSRNHFELRARDGRFHVTDLESSNGLLVNGEAVTSATVGIGDRIQAGSSEFVLDGPTPIFADVTPTVSAAARPADAGTLTAALATALGGIDRGKLYAIVDGAQSLPLAFTARLMGHELYTVF